MALSHLLSPRTAPSHPRGIVSCLCGQPRLLLSLPVPVNSCLQYLVYKGQAVSKAEVSRYINSSTPGLSLAVCAVLAGELPCMPGQLHETTRSLASQCHLPAELVWQPEACKSYPQRASSPVCSSEHVPQRCLGLETQTQRCVWVRTGQLTPQFICKLSVCRITCGRVRCSADYCECRFIASETLSVLGLGPLRNVISFPGF